SVRYVTARRCARCVELLGELFKRGHRSHSSVAVRHGSDGRNIDDVTNQGAKMQFVLMIYQGTTPLPGSDRWQGLSEAEQKAIYADYAELNKTKGVAPGLPLGLPHAAEGAHMHPIARTFTSLDDATEARIRALFKKAVARHGRLAARAPHLRRAVPPHHPA